MSGIGSLLDRRRRRGPSRKVSLSLSSGVVVRVRELRQFLVGKPVTVEGCPRHSWGIGSVGRLGGRCKETMHSHDLFFFLSFPVPCVPSA